MMTKNKEKVTALFNEVGKLGSRMESVRRNLRLDRVEEIFNPRYSVGKANG